MYKYNVYYLFIYNVYSYIFILNLYISNLYFWNKECVFQSRLMFFQPIQHTNPYTYLLTLAVTLYF